LRLRLKVSDQPFNVFFSQLPVSVDIFNYLVRYYNLWVSFLPIFKPFFSVENWSDWGFFLALLYWMIFFFIRISFLSCTSSFLLSNEFFISLNFFLMIFFKLIKSLFFLSFSLLFTVFFVLDELLFLFSFLLVECFSSSNVLLSDFYGETEPLK